MKDFLKYYQVKKIYTKEYQGYDVSCNGIEIDQCGNRNQKLAAWNDLIDTIKSKNITIEYVTKDFNKTIYLGHFRFNLFNTLSLAALFR